MDNKAEKMAKIEIVKLEPAQWLEYKNIRLDALRCEPQAFLTTYEQASGDTDVQWQKRLEESGKGKSWVLFARAAGDLLVGMVGGWRSDEDVANHTVQVCAVYVKREARGQGVAKALMQGILDEFKTAHDIQTVILEVNTDQRSAQKLYEGFGFEVTKTYRHVLGDGLEHEISEMRRALSN